MDRLCIAEIEGACTFKIKVSPRSSQNRVVGIEEGMLKLKVKAPPVDGAANEEVRSFLSDLLECPRTRVVVVKGNQSKRKVVRVTGLTADVIRCRLESDE